MAASWVGKHFLLLLLPFYFCPTAILGRSSLYSQSIHFSVDNTIELFDQTANSIHSGLRYFEQVRSTLTVDALVGAIAVKGQAEGLLRLLSSKYVRSDVRFDLIEHKLAQLYQQSSQVMTAVPRIFRKDPLYFQAIGGILQSEIWSKINCHLRNLNLSENAEFAQYNVDNSSSSSSNNNSNSNSSSSRPFTENESDHCLAEVLNRCRISQSCWTLITEGVRDEYPLSHQVFYINVAQAMKCLDSAVTMRQIDRKVATWCAAMYRADVRVEENNFPDMEQDLFMQNIAFCGYNAFSQFRNKYRWLAAIIGWQNKRNGCFTIDWNKWMTNSEKNSEGSDGIYGDHQITRTRRRETMLSDGCSLHKTSMALASMSIYMQQLVIDLLRQSNASFQCPSSTRT